MRWSDVDWAAPEAVVGRIQDRIFRAAKIKRPRLEPDAEQSARPVLRGLGSGNGARLPDYTVDRKMLTVTTSYGKKTAQVGHQVAHEPIAHRLLHELVQEERSRKGSRL